MNPFDDELHDALAGGAPPPPTPAFDDVRRRARAQQRRQRALLGSGLAVLVVAAGLGTWALVRQDDDPAETDVFTDSPTTESTRPPSTTTTTTTTTAVTVEVPTLEVPAPGDRPDQFVAVDEHGRLVVVETATGRAVRELDADGDPTVPVPPEQEMGPNVLDDVSLAPDGFAYYTSVGEPAGGSVRRRAVDGTPPPEDGGWIPGNDVAVRADGAEVVTGGGPSAWVVAAAEVAVPTGAASRSVFGDQVGANVQFGAVAWSLDGSTIATEWMPYDRDGGPDSVGVAIVPAGGGAPQVVAPADPAGRSYSEPAFRRDGAVVVAEQDRCEPVQYIGGCGNAIARVLDPATGDVLASFEYGTDAAVVDQSYDATGTWLLVAFDDGELRWYGSGESGAIPGRYRAADW